MEEADLVAVKHHTHTHHRAHENETSKSGERRCVRQRGNSKQATAAIALEAYGIPYASSSVLLYRSAITSFL